MFQQTWFYLAFPLSVSMVCRREFLGGAAALAATLPSSGVPGDGGNGFVWGYMPQFGNNMWGDIMTPPTRDGIQTRILTDEEFAVICSPGYDTRTAVRFDEALWRSLSRQIRADGSNLLLIDLGEFVVYPSHPELAVAGSWSAEKMQSEVRRLKRMGFAVVPKLNFSCCHDFWLKDYARMVSTAKYYQVVADLIRDAYEIFDCPEFIHLGMDEEDIVEYQSRNTTLVRFRQGDLWWYDVRYLIDCVEKLGCRAWVWSDYIRRHSMDEFTRKMPKTVLQSPWTYRTEKPSFDDPLIKIYLSLCEAGYDVIPCASNCYGLKENFPATADFCKKNLPSERYKGMLMAPWIETRAPYGRLLLEASSLVAEARRRVG